MSLNQIPFTKMQGLGNDFVVIDATQKPFILTPKDIIRMADRHFGIGFDQLLLVAASDKADIDFNYRIFNADGSEIGQCGNGARCIGRFVYDQGLTAKKNLTLATFSEILKLELKPDGQVLVMMGKPCFFPKNIPFVATNQALEYELELTEDLRVIISPVSLGNPHAVLYLPSIAAVDIEHIGRLISSHPRFPQATNVEIVEVINRNHIKLQVYERGVGKTLACGSGACAAVAVGRNKGFLDEKVQVTQPGGNLTVCWPRLDETISMLGPAEKVYEGTWPCKV